MAKRSRAQRTLTASRVLFGVTVLLSLAFGYFGLVQRGGGGDFADRAYGVMQLFVLGNPAFESPGSIPVLLQIARFTAPAASALAIFEAARLLFLGEYRRWLRRHMRGHVIVTGDTWTANAVAVEVERAGGRVVELRTEDASDPIVLENAGIGRAADFYACADDTTEQGVNVAAAIAATAAKRTAAGRLRVYARIDDAVLTRALRARRLGLPESAHVSVDFFNMDDLAARGLMRAESLANADGSVPHIVVAGMGAFGQALLVELARRWRFLDASNGRRLRVTVVDPAAADAIKQVVARHPLVARECDLRAVPGTLEDLAADVASTGDRVDRAYLCYQDDEYALKAALTTLALWTGGQASLVVRVDRLARLGGAFRSGGPGDLLDSLGHRLRLVAVTELALVPMSIREDLIEHLAESIHENYLIAQAQNPNVPHTSMVSWLQLDEDKKLANRRQAEHIGTKLTSIDCTVAPRDQHAPDFAFTADELETLAELEHVRWWDERLAAGWTYHKDRNDALKHHNCLVPWEDLPEVERQKDRDAVKNIPDILATVGLQVVRLAPAEAPAQLVPQPR